MRFHTRLLAAFTLVAALAAVATVPAAAEPGAQAAKSCGVGNGRGYGTSYVTSLSVTGTSCKNGRKVVKAFHACRPGKKGKCDHAVLGYSCTEKRYNQLSTTYDSKVTCKKGSRRVKHTYTQLT
jgi:uncharacterized membrane protein